jgi:hypothetical protein
MAATTKPTAALTAALLLAASACSNSDAPDIDLVAEPTTTTTTTQPLPSSTAAASAPEAPTTTPSERDQAEAEIRQVITNWYEFPIDTSKGEEGLGLDGTTGPLRQRILESAKRRTAEGEILRSTAPHPIEITTVKINLEEGTAEADACTGSAAELLDAETLEVITTDDPDLTHTSRFYLQLVDEQWTIHEWLARSANPIPCEVLE